MADLCAAALSRIHLPAVTRGNAARPTTPYDRPTAARIHAYDSRVVT